MMSQSTTTLRDCYIKAVAEGLEIDDSITKVLTRVWNSGYKAKAMELQADEFEIQTLKDIIARDLVNKDDLGQESIFVQLLKQELEKIKRELHYLKEQGGIPYAK